jgi:hypothetical protein
MSRRFLIGVGAALALSGCRPDDPITPKPAIPVARQPLMAIVDGTNGGADAFRWLPPIVASADYEGTNDGAATPTVEICVQGVAECTVFATSGVNLPAPQVVSSKKVPGSYFSTSWNTKLYSLDPSKAYRITVRLGAKQQGLADVDVVATNADLASVQPGFAGVVVGDVLEINFRVVRGITKTWVGGASDKGKNADPESMTNWANAANWSPAGVPFRLDTAVVPVTASQPTLIAGAAVGRVVVNTGATLTIGGFNLTVSAGAATVGAGKIASTSGLLLLSGAGTIAGTLPRFVVTGNYSLDGNVSTPAAARIAGGRLVTTGRLLSIAP